MACRVAWQKYFWRGLVSFGMHIEYQVLVLSRVGGGEEKKTNSIQQSCSWD